MQHLVAGGQELGQRVNPADERRHSRILA
jgi:hypothetical protein